MDRFSFKRILVCLLATALLLAGAALCLGGYPFVAAACWALAGLAAGLGARLNRWLSALLLAAALGVGLLYAPGSSAFFPALAASAWLGAWLFG